MDPCWRWCPECGSLVFLDQLEDDDYTVDWAVNEGPGRYDDLPPVGSPA